MAIEPGRNLLHYRLIEKVGEGGMGVVWKAFDQTLDREVALKILPDHLARDPEPLQRFEREAKLLASMNHPNIATIYGLHDVEGQRILVMEFLPGENLAKRLESGPLDTDEALSIFRQVAKALEATHRRAVIHRDLKPANIQLTPEGRVKVLDFGLAKAIGQSAPSGLTSAATIASAPTKLGVVLGTAAYMSPEQARGQPVDAHTDIWAFGCAFYESLTGKCAFYGDTMADLLVAVLTREPDWSALPSDLPPAVLKLLRSCLEKEVEERLGARGLSPSNGGRRTPPRSRLQCFPLPI